MLLLCACSEAPTPQPAAAPDSVATFVGSGECRLCHEPQFSAWQGSHHDLAMQVANARTVLGDFDAATLRYFDTVAEFFTRDGRFFAKTEDADGRISEFQIAYTFGVAPLQQYLVEFPDGRLQPLPFAWDSRAAEQGGQRWFHLYPDEYIGPDDELHWTGRVQNWNHMCAECHSTNVELHYDVDSDSFATTWSEINVGCEACHGPGSLHVQSALTGTLLIDDGLLVDLDDRDGAVWQINPATGIAQRSQPASGPQQQPESCGRCHARRGVLTLDYEYGTPLANTHRVALLDDGLYFPDGQIHDEVYVYGSFVQSRMYRAGVTCSDCHDPHSLETESGAEPSAVCARCHLPDLFAAREHHQHEPGTVACVDCHMPARTYMGVDARRDHSFRIPRPHLSEATGSPSACGTCHDETAASGMATDEPHFATALYAGRRGHANAELVAAIDNNDTPGIARATALSLLAPPASHSDIDVMRRGLQDADPQVRIGALRALHVFPQDVRLELAPTLLGDPIRGVRIEAASVLAPVSTDLRQQQAVAFKSAADEYRAAQFANASRPEAHGSLGEFEAALGDVDKGIAHLNHGLRLDPDFAPLRHALGLMLVRVGRQDEALPELEAATRLAPEVSRYVYVYGVALNSLGRHDDAIRVLDRAMQDFPDDFDIAWALATMLRDAGDLERARHVAASLAERFPDDPNVSALQESLK